jgi:hypothetical protein
MRHPLVPCRPVAVPVLLAGCGLLAALGPAQAAPANLCSDPYWADSLRCAAFPGQVPQPVPPAPRAGSEVKEFTRVELADLDVRCLDGTRPLIYVDPAAGGPSNRWLFTFTGGGSCFADDGDGDGSWEDGQGCLDLYFTSERGEMGTAGEPAMKNLTDAPRGGSQGINSPDLERNPTFARYNRVRIEKCGYDRHQGSAVHEGVRGERGGTAYDFTIWQQGRRIAELALDSLRQGTTYRSWRARRGRVEEIQESLPPLLAAEQVLFVGHSGGAHGLIFNLDALAARLRGWPGFSGDVRGVIDANFLPSVENEAAFNVPPRGDLYDHVTAGESAGAGRYDAEAYYGDGMLAAMQRSWLGAGAAPADLLDASCLAVHGPRGDDALCRDRYHTLLGHVTTPFFVREDRSDSQHTNHGRGHVLEWGEPASYPHCPLVGVDPCPPLVAVGNPSPYRDRQDEQVAALVGGLRTRSELATGEDASGPPPTVSIWMPDCGVHGGAYDEKQYNGTRLVDATGAVTLRQRLEAFVAAPAQGGILVRVDGWAGAVSRCPR